MGKIRQIGLGLWPAGLLLAALVALAGCGSDAADKSGADASAANLDDALADGAESDEADATIDAEPADLPPAPQIQLLPPVLDFGLVELATKYTKPIRICNTGTASLLVSGVEAVELQPGVTLEVDDALAITIDPPHTAGGCDTGKIVQVKIKADAPLAKGATAGILAFSSNDPAAPKANVIVTAVSNAPKLRVTPEDYVDFAFVGLGTTVTRTVELFNDGGADVLVSALTISDDPYNEFKIVPGSFEPSKSSPGQGVLGPGDFAPFEVQVTAKGPVNQQAKATLTIASNDLEKPQWELPLLGDRKPGAGCAITLVPPTVNFGVTPYASQKVATLGLKNTGSGICHFQSAKVTDCPADGFGGLTVPPVCNTWGSTKFQTYAPSPNLFKLQPGDTGTLQMAFIAPKDQGLFGEPNMVMPFYGLVVTEFQDAGSGLASNYPNVKIYDPISVKAAKPNLEAKVGKVGVTVLPATVEFTTTTIGCKAPAKQIALLNTGSMEVFVNKLQLSGCGDEMIIPSPPPIPATGLQITQTTPLTLSFQYAPKKSNKLACQAQIWTSISGVCTNAAGVQSGQNCVVNGDCAGGELCAGQLLTVPLSGEGTSVTSSADVFTPGAFKKVDVLFVIDDSGSMSEEQSALKNSVDSLLKPLIQSGIDYHIGVVSTDMDDASKMGKLQQSAGLRVVTSKTPNASAVLKNLITQGTNGSGTEQGLSAAEAAVSTPLTTDLGKSCNADSDCSSPAKCIPDADDPAVKGCGGVNRTFLRKNASLDIVVLSDEDDSSAADINYYTSFFYSLEGINNLKQVRLHAIVGPKPNGCQSSTGDAVQGDRYIAVANNTGGVVASICDPDLAQTMGAIAASAAGIGVGLPLSTTPIPGQLVVLINGKSCATGTTTWTYSAESNSVYFPPSSSCMPAQGDKVEISYPLLCLP